MLIVYSKDDGFLKKHTITQNNPTLIQNAVWIDLLHPTLEEENWVETALDIDVPTKVEMQEIEASSRFYKDNNSLFMTVNMLANSDTQEPKMDAVTFIITAQQLITVRYLEPHSISFFDNQISQLKQEEQSAHKLLTGLLEFAIDRIADILEGIGRHLDHYSQLIFRSQNNDGKHVKRNFQKNLQDIGSYGDLATKSRESLISFSRLIIYFEQNAGSERESEVQFRLSTLMKDITSLSDYVSFLLNQVNFLLDATLGMINIEQNNIIKIFTIAAVMFLPPTLIASIYGMNFKIIPELGWHYGYPMAIAMMIFSAWLPYRYFKQRKWL